MSPIIILGLVLMWAVVLVPMWLRRHDEVEESRSVDRFSTAMHTLSRHEGRPSQRNVRPTNRPSTEVHVHVSGASAPDVLAARRRRELARRRMQLLGALGLVAIVFFAMAVALGGVLLWVLEVMVDVSLGMYAVHLRRMAVLAAASRRRAVARRRDSAELEQLEREPVPASERGWHEGVTVRRGPVAAYVDSAAVAAAPASDEVFDQSEPWDEAESADVVVAANDGFFDQETDLAVSMPQRASFMETGPILFMETGPILAAEVAIEPEPELEAEPEYANRAARAAAHAAAEAAAVGGKPWEPIPVPKPTYAMKPVAPSRPARQAPRERLLPPVEQVAVNEADDDLEAILDRRWAVND